MYIHIFHHQQVQPSRCHQILISSTYYSFAFVIQSHMYSHPQYTVSHLFNLYALSLHLNTSQFVVLVCQVKNEQHYYLNPLAI